MYPKTAKADVKQIRQTTQYSCVSASICSALAACGKDIPQDQVDSVLGPTPGVGASWEQALAALQYFGMRGTLVVPATIPMLRQWTDAGTPIIIGWTPRDRPWAHASVVFDVDDTNVYVMDPNLPDPNQTTIAVPHADFYAKWFEKHSETMFVRRPALAVTLEVDAGGRQVMASRRKTAKLLPKIWVVRDPSDISELADVMFEANPDTLGKIVFGTGLRQWIDENHTFHDSKDSALKDATARLGKMGKKAGRGEPLSLRHDYGFVGDLPEDASGMPGDVAITAGEDMSDHDHEAGSDGSYMSVGYLKALADKSNELLDYIDEGTPLPDWVEAKIGQAANAINGVRDFFVYRDEEDGENAEDGDKMNLESHYTLLPSAVTAKFEAGKSVDVPKYLEDHGNPEAAKEWVEQNEAHKDQFKTAGAKPQKFVNNRDIAEAVQTLDIGDTVGVLMQGQTGLPWVGVVVKHVLTNSIVKGKSGYLYRLVQNAGQVAYFAPAANKTLGDLVETLIVTKKYDPESGYDQRNGRFLRGGMMYFDIESEDYNIDEDVVNAANGDEVAIARLEESGLGFPPDYDKSVALEQRAYKEMASKLGRYGVHLDNEGHANGGQLACKFAVGEWLDVKVINNFIQSASKGSDDSISLDTPYMTAARFTLYPDADLANGRSWGAGGDEGSIEEWLENFTPGGPVGPSRMASSKTAENLPADVERYVKEIEESNPDYSEAQTWATAWSIYCKHKEPGSDHCKMPTSDYFKKAAMDLEACWGETLDEDAIMADWEEGHMVPTLDGPGTVDMAEWGSVTPDGYGNVLKRADADGLDFTADDEGLTAEGCPDNLDESECKEWEANTEKYKDVVKDKHKVAVKKATSMLNAIGAGDRVTIETPQGQEVTGRAVMKGPAGWVLNMGGPHGRPGIATERNIVKVVKAKNPQPSFRGASDEDVEEDGLMADMELDAKFEKGKPADPTENMSAEDAAEWDKQKDEHKDQFKSARVRLTAKQADAAQQSRKAAPTTVQGWLEWED